MLSSNIFCVSLSLSFLSGTPMTCMLDILILSHIIPHFLILCSFSKIIFLSLSQFRSFLLTCSFTYSYILTGGLLDELPNTILSAATTDCFSLESEIKSICHLRHLSENCGYNSEYFQEVLKTSQINFHSIN